MQRQDNIVQFQQIVSLSFQPDQHGMQSYIGTGTVPPLDARAWIKVRDDVAGPVNPISISHEHFDMEDFVSPLFPHPPRWPNNAEIRDLVLDSIGSTMSSQFHRTMINLCSFSGEPTQIQMEERLRYMKSLMHKESPEINKTITQWTEVGG